MLRVSCFITVRFHMSSFVPLIHFHFSLRMPRAALQFELFCISMRPVLFIINIVDEMYFLQLLK